MEGQKQRRTERSQGMDEGGGEPLSQRPPQGPGQLTLTVGLFLGAGGVLEARRSAKALEPRAGAKRGDSKELRVKDTGLRESLEAEAKAQGGRARGRRMQSLEQCDDRQGGTFCESSWADRCALRRLARALSTGVSRPEKPPPAPVPKPFPVGEQCQHPAPTGSSVGAAALRRGEVNTPRQGAPAGACLLQA